MRRGGRRILTVALVAVGAGAFAPAPAQAGCTEEYEECQIVAWQMSNWLIRELKFVECFAEYVGCLKAASGF